MKPVLVIRHAETEGAGFFGEFLDEHHIRWTTVCLDLGSKLPADISSYRGLVMMGGPMSVNDDLPWIAQELALIRQAFSQNLPILGHCLGGQLISKALGATVRANPVKEIGWGEVQAVSRNMRQLYGAEKFESFHWHGETFDLPKNAELLFSSQYCKNQAYQVGKAIAMQCHIEMTEEMVKIWCENGAGELNENSLLASVQTQAEIQMNLKKRVAALNVVATHLYGHWIAMLE